MGLRNAVVDVDGSETKLSFENLDDSLIAGKAPEADKKTKCCNLVSSLKFCISLKFILLSMNIESKMYKSSKNSYRVSLTKISEAKKFLDWIYKDSTIYLHRKYNLYKSILV